MQNPISSSDPQSGWESHLASRLHLLGHRNWIGIVDSAYPEQTVAGVEIFPTGESHVRVIEAVLSAVSAAQHVRAIAYLDSELTSLDETLAPGIGAFKADLNRVLEGQQVREMAHEDIIEMLDQAGRQFSVLLLKSNLTLPYTSLFLRLECGYWDDDAEKSLRQVMEMQLKNPVQEGK